MDMGARRQGWRAPGKQIPLPWLESNDALALATRMETRLPWRPTSASVYMSVPISQFIPPTHSLVTISLFSPSVTTSVW